MGCPGARTAQGALSPTLTILAAVLLFSVAVSGCGDRTGSQETVQGVVPEVNGDLNDHQPEPPATEPATTIHEQGEQPVPEPIHMEEPGYGTEVGSTTTSSPLPEVEPTATSNTVALPTTVPSPSTGPEPEEAAGNPVIELLIVDGILEGGARKEAVALGDTVTIRVSGNTDGEVHVHGYNLYLPLAEGAGELTFAAEIPGVFEVELERSHTLLIRLEVS